MHQLSVWICLEDTVQDPEATALLLMISKMHCDKDVEAPQIQHDKQLWHLMHTQQHVKCRRKL